MSAERLKALNRLPKWFQQDIPGENTFNLLGLLARFGIDTVCLSAKCPNLSRCFKDKKLTFLILGNTCTRSCNFCNISKVGTSLIPKLSLLPAGRVSPQRDTLPIGFEGVPIKISRAVQALKLRYVVITSVSRDDLPDGGAAYFAQVLEFIHKLDQNIKVEVLIPDFQGNFESLKSVLDAAPCVAGHNLETVRSIFTKLRPQADYQLSLSILSKIKELKPGVFTKSSLMLGLGERKEEVVEAMRDLLKHYCDILTLGQYLSPSQKHYPVKEFVSIEQFQKYQDIGLNMGFKAVSSGPLVRSSYQAEQLYKLAYENDQFPT